MKITKKTDFILLFSVLFFGAFSTFVNTPVMGAPSTQSDLQSSGNSFFYNPYFPETQKKFIDPSLLNSAGYSKVIVTVIDDMTLNYISKFLVSARATPSFNGYRIVRGLISAEKITKLAADSRVLSILKDEKISYDTPIEFPTFSSFQDILKSRFKPESEESIVGKPETTLKDVANITGARKTWETYNINGTGTTIAIVDTGVDYGAPSLGYSDCIARDTFGYPATFDADAECMVVTNITIAKTFTVTDTDTWLETNGTDPLVYNPFLAFSPYNMIPPLVRWSNPIMNGSLFPYPMNITGIVSKSGAYHFGLMFQYLFGFDLFPVLVVDSVTAGVYDKVYVDMSFEWAWLSTILLSPYNSYFGTWPPEFSFADETPVTLTDRAVAARDFTGDGIYDLSAGALGYFLDIYSASPNTEDRGQILKPIAPDGDYVILVNDWGGHGTSCASCAAGRELSIPYIYSGMAPGAKIMGVVALFIGDTIEADLWAAGFDLVPSSQGWRNVTGFGTVWGTWNYTENHKADVISHSWGTSNWAEESLGMPWYSLLTVFEDALTAPGYFAPNYPGTVIVQAGGNGAAGYGTVTEPAYATLPITVGASTSMNWTHDAFGFAGGGYDEVIPWSARGPTPLGNVKPDVVHVGARGWAAGPVWYGEGNGKKAYELFGGTSMSAPLTAGTSALTIQAYSQNYGVKSSPEDTKVILKSSAKDLGYDAFVQGAGRVDAFAAVDLALAMSGITVASSATWKNIRPKITDAWTSSYNSLGKPLSAAPPSEPIFDVNWYAGTIRPGESTTTEFTIRNLANQPVVATITPVTYEQIGTSLTYSNSTHLMPSDWVAKNWVWGNLTILNLSSIPNGTDLMLASLWIPYKYFDTNGDYSLDHSWGICILDWIDAPPYGIVNINEVHLLNYGYNSGTSNEARVSFPLSKIKGKPVIFVYQNGTSSVPFNVGISYYERSSWTWIETPANVSISSSSYKTFIANLSVPTGTLQGVYEGQIKIETTSPYNKTIMVPVSLQVADVLSSDSLVYNFSARSTSNLYDSFRVNGYFDWSWRQESGDWKQWAFDLQDPNVVAAFVSTKWTGNMTDIDMFGINPAGIMADGAASPNLYGGAFRWQTRTGTKEEYVALNTRNFAYSQLGTYTVLLHNVLFDGAVYPENVTGKVELVKLSPNGPIDITTSSGHLASQSFTIISGRNLTDIKLFTNLYSSNLFSVEFTPDHISNVNALVSTEFTMKITVPQGTAEGTYPYYFLLQARELPSPVLVFTNIIVDNTPPVAGIITPTPLEYISGSCNITVFAFDPNINSINLSVDSSNLTSWTTNGIHSFTWDASSANGSHTIVLNVYDKSGTKTEKTITVNVDNTPPSVGIVTPQAGATLNGIVAINFTASDTNLNSLKLLIDQSVFNVTRATSYQWDTTKIGDGTHTIKLIAYDKAGNTAETSVSVSTINSKLNIEANKNLYLAIGTPLGFMLGVLVAYMIFKRKE